jgi:hypothetical protein
MSVQNDLGSRRTARIDCLHDLPKWQSLVGFQLNHFFIAVLEMPSQRTFQSRPG